MYFLEQEASGSPRAAHDTVVVVSDPIVPTHRRKLGRAALWPQKYLRAPRAWIHTADAAHVTAGTLAWVCRAGGQGSGCCLHAHMGQASAGSVLTTGAVELLKDILLARAGVAQELALAGVVSAVTATHRALWGSGAGCRAQARGCLSIG